MVGTRRSVKGQNMEFNEKRTLVRNVYKSKKCPTMYRTHIFLDETGRILNKKVMPDVSAMVPEYIFIMTDTKETLPYI
jgi:hypothetical protein